MNTELFLKSIPLPKPHHDSDVSIENALLKRRSIRSYKSKPLTITDISQLLWSAQGVTSQGRNRTAPSAGALYPIEVYVSAGNVVELDAGIYKYHPNTHEIFISIKGDKRSELCSAALNQGSIKSAPAVIIFSAIFERVTRTYGERGVRYVYMEAGHAIQNVCLQAISLGLGTVVIGAFNDNDVKDIVKFEQNELPLLLLPVGHQNHVLRIGRLRWYEE